MSAGAETTADACACAGTHTAKGRHVTAVDLVDAEAIIEIVREVGPGRNEAAKKSVARLLADKREEWLLCAITRVEQTFRGMKRKEGR